MVVGGSSQTGIRDYGRRSEERRHGRRSEERRLTA
jgi:hypothetical protein